MTLTEFEAIIKDYTCTKYFRKQKAKELQKLIKKIRYDKRKRFNFNFKRK